MPREARKYSSLKVYHIILRGIDKQDIFLDTKDKIKFLVKFKKLKEKYKYNTYAYCLMDNHVHLVIHDKENKISKIMQSLEIGYSRYFNKKYDRTGHLFQNRFLSKTIEEKGYFLNVCRYIHKNPEKAGICKTNEYKWSSYNEYITNRKSIIDRKPLMLLLSNDVEEKEEFVRFHNLEENKCEMEQYTEYEIEDLNDEKIIEYISEKLQIDNIRYILNCNIEKRNELITQCKVIANVSNRQLARILGINRKIIDRAIQEKTQKIICVPSGTKMSH